MSNESIYKSTLPFTPVTTTDERIHQADIVNGCVYFATDSGKIYLDMHDERVSLGGSGAAVIYCNSTNVLKDVEGNYILMSTDLFKDSNEPKPNDLIINSDGRFFRVNYYNKFSSEINCSLLAVSGSGSGSGSGGSGGGGDVSDPKVINVEYYDIEYAFLYGQPYTINFTANAAKDPTLNVEWEVYNNRSNSTPIDTGTRMIKRNELVELEVGKKMTPDGGYHRVNIKITGANSNPYEKDFNKIKCVDLRIENDTNFQNHQIFKNNFTYSAVTYGQIDKTFHVAIDGIEEESVFLANKENGYIASKIIDCDNITPGAHTLTAWLESEGVPSNILTTDFVYHPGGVEDTTYVLVSNYPSRVLSYEIPAITYWVYNTALAENSENTINLLVNGVEVASITHPQKSNDPGLTWNVTGLIPNASNVCAIQSGGVSREISIYCEKSDIFDEITGFNYLLLNADGRSNNVSLEKRLDWSYSNNYGKHIKAELKNFNWNNNGWMTDDDGRNCLRVSNGASVEIPLEGFFTEAKPTHGGYTFEFEFKPYNLYSYNLLTQSTTTIEGDSEEDDEVTIEREFDSSLASISYVDYDGDKVYGLCCGTQDAFFRMSNGSNVSVRYMEDKVVNIAVTIDAAKSQILMYVNGVASGMTGYITQDAALPIYANKLIINSNQCDLDLYTIRIYKTALSSQDIVQNYIASKKDLNIYEQNSFAAGSKVVLSELKTYNTDNPDNATIPYIVFKTSAPDILPYNKANADVICDIEFTNPALDYALKLSKIDESYYKKHCPSFLAKGVTLNVQGTSSQKYPRKNFKGKFKKATEWNCTNELIEDKQLSKFYMDDSIAEKTFTWKADYMDSSSCHNTGFASYAYDLYWNHPVDFYENTNVNVSNNSAEVGTYHKQYRTSLYGFPVLAFHEKSDGTTEFIGRYNFNLDKGADDTLGMALDKQHPILTDKTYEEVCECWEFANNMGGRCSFRGNPFDYGYDYTKQKYLAYNEDGTVNEDAEGMSDIGDDLEVRYHINGDAIEGAWKNLTLPAEDGGTPISSKEAFELLIGGNADGTGRTGAYRNLEVLFKWLQDCYYAFDLNDPDDLKWAQSLMDRTEVKDDDEDFKTLKNERRAKFESEFNKHLNMEYCLIYYIMTELLLQYDSRGKNMMLASWGPMEQGGDYIWFPIFYDVDTQLGVNNSGVPSWEYNVEPTTGFNNANNKKAFSTANSLLWNNFHKSYAELSKTVQQRYQVLRGKNLTIAKLNGYYDFNYEISKAYCMKGILPINVMNANQNYKYIAPSVDGYITGVDDTGAPIYRKTSAYFYCLQGTRDLHRALFLRNRFNYYDSKWMAQAYQPGTGGLTMRWRANSFKSEEHPELNSNLILKIKPALDQYLVLWPDESATYVVPVFVKGGQIATIDLSKLFSSETYQQQIIYIGGYTYLQEFGNVSLLYLDEYEYPTDANLITKIEMGNENILYESDDQFTDEKIEEASKQKYLLKVFDITNLKKVDGSINLTDSIKLETFKALGSKITGATFAPGVNLKHLYLPNTVNNLTLSLAPNLKKIVYNKNDIKYTDENNKVLDTECMYIEDVIYTNNDNIECTNINDIKIKGGNLNLYSYEFLEKLTNAKAAMNANGIPSKLGIQLTEVHWTPFTQLGAGAIYDQDKKDNYKYATNNYSYIDYEYNKNTWDNDVLEGRIYLLEASDIQPPVSLDLLNTYIEDEKQIYVNATDVNPVNYPELTGDLYIENDEDNPVSEALLANYYNSYFPGLKIKAKVISDAYRVRFVQTYSGVEKEIMVQRFDKTETDINISSPAISSIPNPVYYRFYGWTTEKPEGLPYINEGVNASDNILIADENGAFDFSNYDLNEITPELTFYAIYQRDEFAATYYDKFSDTDIQQIGPALIFRYGSVVKETDYIPNRATQENSLALNRTYRFKGWTQNKNKSGILTNINEVNSVIEKDIASLPPIQNYTFYAVYFEEDAFESATADKYFNFNEINDKNLGVGYRVSINPQYRDYINGKITLPAKHNDVDVVCVGDFAGANQITHVFFQNNSNYVSISNKAFYVDVATGLNVLKAVFMPPSIKYIGDFAFRAQTGLTDIAITNDLEITTHLPEGLTYIGERAFGGTVSCVCKFKIDSLPESLTELGTEAFYRGGSNIKIHKLPSKLTKIKGGTFNQCPNVTIDTIGSDNNDIDFSIGSYAFFQVQNNNGANRTEVLTLTLGSNVTTIENDAFREYGPKEGLVAYTTRALEDILIEDATEDNPAGNTGLANIISYKGTL